MSIKLVLMLLALSGAAGIVLGYILRWLVALGQRGSLELDIKQQMLEAKERATKIEAQAELRAAQIEEELLVPLEEREGKLTKMEERLSKKEEFLDERERGMAEEAENIRSRENEAERLTEEAEKLIEERQEELANIAHISKDEALRRLTTDLEQAHENALLARLQKLEATGRERLEEKARGILTTVIHRLRNAVNAEVTPLAVAIPSEEMKGKIIGKEGRNIKAFERATGVDVLIDDAPDKITLSSFDPLRRHIAKIEEFVEKTKQEVADIVKQKGEEAAYETGVIGLDTKLTQLLGRLHYRTSYGQNVLTHSIEMAHIASMLASELGADVTVAKTGALLHDICKAVDHEVSGTHVEIGRRILEKFGIDKRVIQAMQSHHEEYPYETPESIIVQVADAISGGRPGARRDSVENYIKRLTELEAIATSFAGVEKAYAIQAGRELRIFVTPSQINDLEA